MHFWHKKSEFLCMLPDQPHIICLRETKIFNEPKINVSLPGYFFYFSKSITYAGGVGIFVSSSLHHKEVSSYNLNLTTCENQWISVTCPFTQKKFVIGCIYRHRSSTLQPFCDCLSDSLANLNEANKHISFLVMLILTCLQIPFPIAMKHTSRVWCCRID